MSQLKGTDFSKNATKSCIEVVFINAQDHKIHLLLFAIPYIQYIPSSFLLQIKSLQLTGKGLALPLACLAIKHQAINLMIKYYVLNFTLL